MIMNVMILIILMIINEMCNNEINKMINNEIIMMYENDNESNNDND